MEAADATAVTRASTRSGSKGWWRLFHLAKRRLAKDPDDIWGHMLIGILEVTASAEIAETVRERLASASPEEHAAVMGVDPEVLEVFEETQHPPGLERPASSRPAGRVRRRQRKFVPWWARSYSGF